MKTNKASITKWAAYPAIATLSLGALLSGAAPASAAELTANDFSNVVVTVDRAGDLNANDIVNYGELVDVTLSFDIADSVQGGDTVQIRPNPKFAMKFINPIELRTADGTVIGTVTPVGAYLATIEFNDAINNLQNVSASFTAPWGVGGVSAAETDRHDMYYTIADTQFSSGEAMGTPIVKRLSYSAGMASLADPAQQLGFDLYTSAHTAFSASDQVHDVTYTFNRSSDNWEFNPADIQPFVQVFEDGFTPENGEKTIRHNWSDFTVDSISKDAVVVTVKNVPGNYGTYVKIPEAGVTPLTIDGNDYTMRINILNNDNDGKTKSWDALPAKATSAVGLSAGETITPNFTFDALVAGKDADTAADAHRAEAGDAGTVTAPVTVTIKNTGNISLFNPVITGSDGSSHTLDGVTIKVGETYTAELGQQTYPVGDTTVTYTAKANGVTQQDPVVVSVAAQKVGTVTAKFVDQNGKDIKDPVTVVAKAKVGSAYDATKNKVQTIPGPDGTRYELVKVTGAETGKVTEGSTTITYGYQKVASWVPSVPGKDLPKIPYPFTPDGGVGEGVIPHVDGYVPLDPKTGEPLKPVDPKDPSKGYVAPKPSNPGEETAVSYKALGDVIVKFVDAEGKEVAPSVTLQDDAVEGTAYDATGQKQDEIPAEEGARYVLIATPDNVKGKVAKGETVVSFTYQRVASWVPLVPGVDKVPYPFTPEGGVGEGVIPHVDDYVPVDPITGEPLKPVDPEDLTKGYIAPKPNNPGEETFVAYLPIADPDTFTTKQGEPVTLSPADNDGEGFKVITLVDPVTGNRSNEVTVPGEGSYMLSEDGKVTFTPEPGFTGVTTPVMVVSIKDDIEATPVELTGMVTPAGSPDTFETVEGTPLTMNPSDNDGENTKVIGLVGEDGNPTNRLEFPDKGVVTLNEDGTITITPEPGFTGDFPEFSYIPGNDKGDRGEPITITGKVDPKPVAEEPKAETPAAPSAGSGATDNGQKKDNGNNGATTAAPAAPVAKQDTGGQAAAPAATTQKTSTPAKAQLAYTGADSVGIFAAAGTALLGLGAALTRRFRKES